MPCVRWKSRASWCGCPWEHTEVLSALELCSNALSNATSNARDLFVSVCVAIPCAKSRSLTLAWLTGNRLASGQTKGIVDIIMVCQWRNPLDHTIGTRLGGMLIIDEAFFRN